MHSTTAHVSCPSPDELSHFARKQIDPQAAAQIQGHLQICAPCRRVVDESRAQLRSEFATQDTPAPQPAGGASTVSLAGSTGIREPVKPPSSTHAAAGFERYRIGEEIARGGMGVVHRATDLLFKREVAIKLLHPKLQNNPQALEAFRYEAEITARLQHPGIPPMHDLGTLADGRPFLAMKLIQGKTLHELLKARESLQEDLPRWLQIFEQIAQAVGYAHSQNIIHRDLKPLNVMVGEFGEVQVMDWGLAKVVGEKERPGFAGEVVEREFATLPGIVKGTLQYMPPEQARGEIDRLDSRADVFGLGSILCQILTGEAPYSGKDGSELRRKAAAADLASAHQQLLEIAADAEIIELAVACLSAKAQDRPANGTLVAQAVANHRLSVEQRLRQAETERALSDQRLVEQSRRRKLWYAVAGALLLFGIASSAFGAYYARSTWIIADKELRAKEAAALANTNAQRANQASQLATERQQRAEDESAATAAVNDFLQNDLLRLAAPDAQFDAGLRVGPDLKVRDLVLRAAERIEDKFGGRPLVEARIRHSLGVSLWRVGEYKIAVRQLERAFELFSNELGNDDPSALASLHSLGNAYGGASQLDRAIAVLEEALRRRRSLLGADHPDTLDTMNSLASRMSHNRQTDEGLRLMKEVWELRVAKLGSTHPDTLDSLDRLGVAYRENGQNKHAIQLHRDALQLRQQVLGKEHTDTLMSMTNLANDYVADRQAERALPIFREVIEIQIRNLGGEHPETIVSIGGLAGALFTSGDLTGAIESEEKAFELSKRKLGQDHDMTLTSMVNLATMQLKAGKTTEAIKLYEECAWLGRAKLGPDHPAALLYASSLAAALVKADRSSDALQIYEDVFNFTSTANGAGHPTTVQAMIDLAWCESKLDRPEVAERRWNEAYDLAQKLDNPDKMELSYKIAANCVRHYELVMKKRELDIWNLRLVKMIQSNEKWSRDSNF